MRLYLLALTIGLTIPTAHAGLFDAINAVSQIAGNVSNVGKSNNANNNYQANNDRDDYNQSTAPLSTYELSTMDCPSLEIAALSSNRELELAKANLAQIDALNKNPQYQQQKTASAAIGALGSMFANKGGKSGEYAQIAQQLGGSGNTTADMNVDTQLALGKKYMADLDNIRIYQKYKKCK